MHQKRISSTAVTDRTQYFVCTVFVLSNDMCGHESLHISKAMYPITANLQFWQHYLYNLSNIPNWTTWLTFCSMKRQQRLHHGTSHSLLEVKFNEWQVAWSKQLLSISVMEFSWMKHTNCVCVCVCVCMYMCVCVCVCVYNTHTLSLSLCINYTILFPHY
jgi:hypothetical protein